MTGRRVLAVVLSAVVGVAAGVTTALVGPASDGGGATGSGSPGGPLVGLNAQLANQPCTDQSILVLAHGDGVAPLSVGIGDATGARYLEVAESCPTLYASADKGVPTYAAYLGPFDTLQEACELRMTVVHRGDTVTRLHRGNDEFVRCACSLPSKAAPVLRPGERADTLTALWVRQLQGMLTDMGDGVDGGFTEDDVSGVYDTVTQGRIVQLQNGAGIGPPLGVVGPATWGVVKARACDTYDY